MSDVKPDDDHDQTMCQTNDESSTMNSEICDFKATNRDELQSASTTAPVDKEQEDQAAPDRDTATRGNPLDSCFHINNIESKTISIAPAKGETPLPIFPDKVFKEGCNPDKYAYGTGGLAANRTTKLTAKKYFNQRIFDADRRVAQYAVESKSIQDQIRIAFRKIKENTANNKNITAGLLKNNDEINQLIHTNQAFKFMKNVRGLPPYWQKVFYDVLAMVRQLGCPTWFISLSAADHHWPELLRLLASKRGKPLTDEDIKQLS